MTVRISSLVMGDAKAGFEMHKLNIPAILAQAVWASILYALWRTFRFLRSKYHERQVRDIVKDGGPQQSDPYQDIEPLDSFDWSSTQPIKLRPFKPKFHLTMGLENCPLSELLEIDSTYLDRIKLRKEVLDSHPSETYLCNKACEPAVLELHEWLMSTYLPRRFPRMYRRIDEKQTQDSSSGYLHNIAANTHIPLKADSGLEALYSIGTNIDADFLLLLPSSVAQDGSGSPIYHLEAFVCCFPSGFRTRQKLSLPLAAIHEPVPGYPAKLEKSMDRFFAKLETGRAVKRANWSITTDSRLFSLAGNHMYEGGSLAQKSSAVDQLPKHATDVTNTKTLDVQTADLEAIVTAQEKEVIIENCRLRCERQTLHRLPKSRALVFVFKTYLDRLEDVKSEGSGPALADAIDGLTRGNVPEISFYKRGVVWGSKVKEYMRS